MEVIQTIESPYVPRPLQAELYGYLKRFNVIVCHRRWGKTVFCVNEIVDQALRNTRHNPRYAYIAPTYGQAERIAWDMLKTYTKHIPGVDYNQQKLTCTIPRPHMGDNIKIMLMGAENPDSIRGIYLDGCVLDEYAEMDPRVFGEIVRPLLTDRLGWAIFIGTPKGQNHFYEVHQAALEKMREGKNWFTCIHKASTSGVLPIEELMDAKADMTEDQYEQEFECSFNAALVGAYWGKAISEMEAKNRVGKVPHDPSLPVETYWDLGVSDSVTVWFVQQTRLEVRIIDYYEGVGKGIPDVAKMLTEGHRREYKYEMHHWPHDGDSRDFSTGKERSTTARTLGIKPLQVHPKYEVADSIDAARRLFARCWFDKEKTSVYLAGDKGSRGLESLKNYQKKWDAKNKVYLDNPLHNWASHGADGFRLLGMALKPGQDRRQGKNDLPRQAQSSYNVFGYNNRGRR